MGVSYSHHTDDVGYGILNTTAISKQLYSKYRLDVTHRLSKKIDLNTGGEYEYNENKFDGTVRSILMSETTHRVLM